MRFYRWLFRTPRTTSCYIVPDGTCMTQGVSTTASDQQRRQIRRVCARARSLYRRIDRICGQAHDADVVGDEVARIVADSRSLLHSIEMASLVPIQLRDALDQAAIGLDQLGDYTQIPVDICKPLNAALRGIERHMESLTIDSPPSNSSEDAVVRRIVGRVAEHPIFA